MPSIADVVAVLRHPGFGFAEPWALALVALAPLVYALASGLPSSVAYSSLSLVGARGERSLRVRLAWVPAALLALATALLAVALAGPRTGDAVTRVEREGIAIAMVVDRSGSMEARDFVRGDASASRLDVVKQIFRDFVTGGDGGAPRDDDLIGLVAFARYADGLCPLTLDHGNLLAILGDVATPTEPSEDGTAIGEGLALAVERLRRQETASKVAILLTDGVSNAGEIDPLQAADLAAQYGIKVYAIGAGRSGFAPFPVRRPDGRTTLQRARVEMDELTLQRIAQRTGGRYFHATDADGLRQVVDEIGRLERSEVAEVRYLEYEHHFAPVVAAALACAAVAALLGATWLRRLPA